MEGRLLICQPVGQEAGRTDIDPSTTRVVGRVEELCIRHPKVSREHATVEHAVLDGEPAIRVTAAKRSVYVSPWRRVGADGTGSSPPAAARMLHPGESELLREGDSFYLLRLPAGCEVGYHVALQGGPRPAPKRRKKQQQQPGKEQVAAARPAAKAAARPAAEPGLFSGLRFVWWASKWHASRLMELVGSHGGVIDQPSVATTHIIAEFGITREEAYKRLGIARHDALAPTQSAYDAASSMGVRADRVAVVTRDYLSSCLAAKRLLPLEGDAAANVIAQTVAALPAVASGGGGGETRGSDSSRSLSPHAERGRSPTPPQQQLQQGQGAAEATTPVGPAATGAGQQHPAAVQLPTRFTGGSTGIPWGTDNVWDEEFDEASARETIVRLRSFWARGAAALAAHDAGGIGGVVSPTGSSAAAQAGACGHVACGARSFCIIEAVKAVKATYTTEGAAQFRRKHLEDAVNKLIALDVPLERDAQVEALLGRGKTGDKVKEILATGSFRRANAVLGTERHKAVSLFLKVWGAGDAAVERWYASGCRTLDDVRRREDLTSQQVVSLKYFDDLQQRIPREQVAAFEAAVQQAMGEVARAAGAQQGEIMHCRCTGSYLRGKPSTGDIDVLIVLPASLEGHPCGRALTDLLRLMVDRGLLLDELSPLADRSAASAHHASFSGMARAPGCAIVRRADIKVYPHSALPFAVNFFVGSGSVCRALRHWAIHNSAEAVARAHPGANSFKLNDLGLYPARREWSSEDRAITVQQVGPCVDNIRSEGDIWRMLGLSYVPYTMRFFGQDYE